VPSAEKRVKAKSRIGKKMLLLVRESVIASGNSSFQENLDLETTNLYTNHLLDL